MVAGAGALARSLLLAAGCLLFLGSVVLPSAAQTAAEDGGGDDADPDDADADRESDADTDADADADADAEPVLDVDDPLLSVQWYLERTRTRQAWTRTTGSSQVTVAVVDTGVQLEHPDLVGAAWTGGFGGAAGFDYLRSSLSTYVTPDEDWHGTAVTGVLAARADDGFGMAGVAPGVRVMVRRIYASPGVFQSPRLDDGYGEAAAAVREAAEDGADVILITWGGTRSDLELFRAIRDSGVPVVAAAGNDGVDLDIPTGLRRFPAVYDLPNLVTVAASDRTGALLANERTNSNHGARSVDLAAPGEEIVSTLAGSGHRLFEGTSFAAPQVAGALALGRSLAPAASAEELTAALVASARLVPELDGHVASGGELDALAFLRELERPVCTEELATALFLDVLPGSAHAVNVDCVAAYGVARGVETERYAPAATVTRGQMATFLARMVRAAGWELPDTSTPRFRDATATVHRDAIDAVAELGIAQGREDGTFGPNDPVSRGQMATFLVRTAELLTGPGDEPGREWFDDIDGHPHERSILVARDLGLTFGGVEPRLFNPDDAVTRGQMASFLARAMDACGRQGQRFVPLS